MRVAELVAPGGIELACHTISDPGPGQVQVKVGAVGICGSDVLSFSCGGIGGMECQYPQVLGHEATGVVVRTGEGVNGWAVGNRVALEPALYCYHCELCMSGRHNICERVRFHSSAGVPGFLRECVSLPAENLLPLPPEIDLNYGTLFEPLAVVLHAMKFAQLQPLETAAVFGAGPIGLLTIALLKMSGAGRTYAIEPVAFRRELAIQAGADAAIDPREVAAAVQVARETAGRGVDLTMDCAARKTSLDECVETTRNGGRLVVLGIPHELELPFNWHVARRKELIIYNVRRSNRESETALQLLKEQPRQFRFLFTHALPLERTQSAFEMLRDQSEGAGKVVIVFQ